MSESAIKCAMPTLRESQTIQKHNDVSDTSQSDEYVDRERSAPLGLAHTPPRGARHIYEIEEHYVDNMCSKRMNRTSC
eukprot:5423697-Amphidinium_carterae.1